MGTYGPSCVEGEIYFKTCSIEGPWSGCDSKYCEGCAATLLESAVGFGPILEDHENGVFAELEADRDRRYFALGGHNAAAAGSSSLLLSAAAQRRRRAREASERTVQHWGFPALLGMAVVAGFPAMPDDAELDAILRPGDVVGAAAATDSPAES